MKIGINARLFSFDQFTGIARSVKETLVSWMKNHPEHEYCLFTNKPLKLDIELPENWRIICEPCLLNEGIIWENFKLPQLIKREMPDVFWGPDFSLPRKIKGVSYFVTIYDLAAFKVKGVTSYKNLLRLKLVEKSACKRANKVIAISQATANDITEVFGISTDKIEVVYLGGLPETQSTREYKEADVKEALRFSEEYFLFISTIEPRKNIPTIIHAYEKFVDETGSNMKLVLVGKIGWMCEDVLSLAKNSKYAERIIMPGYISDTERIYLLSHASVFLYPSLYEGFGMPILEAFEYSLPVITSRVSSMPEVGGDAAFYIDDPYDIHALSGLMDKVCNLSDKELDKVRERISIQKGKFSWEESAEELMNIFENSGRI